VSTGTSLRHVLATLGEPLVEVVVAPHGLGVGVTDVVILDPEDPLEASPGDLVLVIGARGRAAAPAIRAAGRGGAAAVAVKGATGADVAADAGVALLTVGAEARWEQVESLARGVVEAARAGGEAAGGEVLGDLFALAQTIATLTGGLVSIEDTANRVLAYSRAGDEVDELRRLSILGREGPERYLAMLREWGVYQRLRAGEGIVRVDERPDLGIRRRIAAGIHAGKQPLGTIWVQEGAQPLTERAELALLGASRTLAPQLIRARTLPSPELRLRVRVMNSGRNDVNFWDDSFRLAVGGDVLSPTSGLNSLAPGNSLRYGIITFRLRPQTRSGTLRIVSNQETAEIPLDLSPTGRPPVDEQAEIADSSAQAITAGVVSEPVPLFDGGDMSVTLQRASTRRFANALRFNLSLRMANRGRYDAHSTMIMMRADAGGEQRPPFQFPNTTIAAMATATGNAIFDLPTTATRAVVRTTIGDQTTEKTFDLK